MSLNTYDKDLKQKILVDGTDEVDSALSATSTNPVENRVITEELVTRDAEISEMNNILGAKNLLPLTSVSQLYRGVTYTVNTDGSVTATGTATGGPSYFWFHGNVTIENKYKGMLVSGATGGDADTYGIFINLYSTSSGGTVVNNYSQTNDDFTIPNDDNNGIKFGIYVREGITVSNQVFYPMIRPASIKDHTYVPYAMTNRELTNAVTYSTTETEVGTFGIHKLYRKILDAEVSFPANTYSVHMFNNAITDATFVTKIDYLVRQVDGSYVTGVAYDDTIKNSNFAFANTQNKAVGIAHNGAVACNHVTVIVEYIKD